MLCYMYMFGSSGSESEDGDSDVDISLSEGESETGEIDESEVEDSAEPDEDETTWTVDLTNIDVGDIFVSPTAIAVELSQEAKELDCFKLLFDDDIIEHVIAETSLYAQQKLSGNPQRLEKWKPVMSNELRAYFGVCIIMGAKFFAIHCSLLVNR